MTSKKRQAPDPDVGWCIIMRWNWSIEYPECVWGKYKRRTRSEVIDAWNKDRNDSKYRYEYLRRKGIVRAARVKTVEYDPNEPVK